MSEFTPARKPAGRPARRRRRNRLRLVTYLVLAAAGVFGLVSVICSAVGSAAALPSASEADSSVRAQTSLSSAVSSAESSAAVQEKILSRTEKLRIIRSESAYPEEMAVFAEKHEEVIDYVFDYPKEKDKQKTIDLSAEAASGSVPLLLQWDSRWGYLPYGDGLIGYTGCGPTCLSMAALYLTGNSSLSPAKVARFSEDGGYCVPGNGSSWTLISEGSRSLGLSARELPLSEALMEQELDEKHPIIAVVGPGDFTDSGHFLVITGYRKDGFTVNDPNSRKNSAKPWSYEAISGQIRNLWAMSKR